MKDFVIYTAIVGGYDNILQPLVTDERFDYILFSNDIPEKQIGIWKVRPIPYNNNSQTKIARWVKTHPEQLLSEYECSIWIDANIQISSSYIYSKSIDLHQSSILISSMKHPVRDCIYDEAAEVLTLGLDHEKTIVKWLHQLRWEGFPIHYGLYETGIMFRKHRNVKIKQFDKKWWECISFNSKRDQLSFSYALYKIGLTCGYFLPDGEDVRLSERFNYIYHDTSSKIIRPNEKEDPLFTLFNKKHNHGICKRPFLLYRKIATFHSPRLLFYLFCQYYRINYLFSK